MEIQELKEREKNAKSLSEKMMSALNYEDELVSENRDSILKQQLSTQKDQFELEIANLKTNVAELKEQLKKEELN